MSSYQFVNTLAQCYEQAGGVGGVPGAGAATPHEYYGMQYPACYSPATQAYSHQYATMMAGAGAPTQQQQQQQADYNSPPSAAAAAAAAAAVSLSHRRSPVSGSGLGGPGLPPVGAAGSLTPSGVGGGGLNPLGSIIGGGAASAAVLPQPNCKYADSNVGSPQDLSTNSSGGTPQPGGGPHGGGGLGGGGGPKSPESELEEDEEPSSPLSPSPGASGSGTKKEGGGDSKSNPPQIYPWMKRVHLGQSKSLTVYPFFRHFCRVTQ
jgi:Antp family protein